MIRWIVPGRLATGAALDADLPGALRLDVRHMVDAAGNAPETVADLVDRGAAMLESGRTVLVVCDFGVSRSNAVAAGMLARWRNLSFDAALADVMARTGETEIKIEMIDALRTALGSVDTHVGRSSMRTVMVTGAGGFVGRHVVRAFEGGSLWAPPRTELDLLTAPARIRAALEAHDVGCAIHLAQPRIYTNTAALGQALSMQKALIDAVLSVGARLVLVSCASVFGCLDTSEPLPPETPTAPRSTEGMTKALQEQLVRMTVAARGLKAQIVRLPQIYGPGGLRPRFLEIFARAIANGEAVHPHRFDDGPAQVGLLHVADAAQGLRLIAGHGSDGIHHLSAPDILGPAEIAAMMARRLDRPLRLVETRVAGRADRVRLDGTAVSRDLGWTPHHRFDAALPSLLDAFGIPAGSA